MYKLSNEIIQQIWMKKILFFTMFALAVCDVSSVDKILDC